MADEKPVEQQGAAPPADAGNGAPAEDANAYFPVPLQSLQVDGEQQLRLYVRLADSDQYVPYGDDNFTFSAKHREELEQRGVVFVYVAAADRLPYLRHMEAHLDELIADEEHLTPGIKADVLYECVSQLTESLLESPQENNDLDRVTTGANALVRFILAKPGHLRWLLVQMGSVYQLNSHATNACILGLGLGVRLGLSEEELTDLGTGLLLMDLGKAEIDRAILEKTSALSEEEWEIMRRHPERGVELLRQMGEPSPGTLAVVLQHHERCTGTGYPEGRRGSQIHLFAKIAGLVDVFDALTTKRSYRQALASFPAVRVMQGEMPGQFGSLLFRELIVLLGDSAQAGARPSLTEPTSRSAASEVA
jgi:HD-GYP domain-containing protein (c-di-GMP phosphodiesterase class II)